MPDEETPPRRGRSRATPTPPTPPDPWLIFWAEAKLAGIVTLSLLAVVLARRWATRLLGNEFLSAEILAGGALVNDLITRVESNITKEDNAAPRAAGTSTRRPTDT